LKIDIFLPWATPILDEIDRALAKAQGFCLEELDFVINCDIKYRMGISHAEGTPVFTGVTEEGIDRVLAAMLEGHKAFPA
jgi:hypothetical protein